MGPETALLAAAIASTAAAGVATLQGVAQANAAAAAEETNAKIQQQNAKLARDKAVAREIAVRRETRRGLALQNAAQAESGFATSGSSALALEQSAMLGEFDALLMRYGGDLESSGFAFDAELARNRARGARATIPGTLLAGGLGMGASALAGYGNFQAGRSLPAGGPAFGGSATFGGARSAPRGSFAGR